MSLSLLDLVVPGGSTIITVLGEAFSLCQDIKEGHDSCAQAHGRPATIFKELEKMEKQGELPPSEALATYTSLVVRFLAMLKDHTTKSFCGASFSARA
jgi:hypothetical protein